VTAKEVAKRQAEPTRGRFVLGACVFVFGILCPLFVPFVAMSELGAEWKATLSGALLIGIPEVFTLIAVAILGKPGYEALKRKLLSVLRWLRPADRVGPVRHRVGVAMFALPVLVGWPYPYIVLWFSDLAEYGHQIALILDAIFFSSFFVLGGDFWDKFSALFKRTRIAD
jgi:hypothetical protein